MRSNTARAWSKAPATGQHSNESANERKYTQIHANDKSAKNAKNANDYRLKMVITDTSFRSLRLACGTRNLGVIRGQNTKLYEIMIENIESNAGDGRGLKANG